jgi:hypothetical protein
MGERRVAGVDEQRLAAEGGDLLLRRHHQQRMLPQRPQHRRGDLLVTSTEQEPLPADDGDDRAGRNRASGVGARGKEGKQLLFGGVGQHERAAANHVDAQRRLGDPQLPGDLHHGAAGAEEVEGCFVHRPDSAGRGRSHGRCLRNGSRTLAGLRAPGDERHLHKREQTRIDASVPNLILVDVEDLTLLERQGLAVEPAGDEGIGGGRAKDRGPQSENPDRESTCDEPARLLSKSEGSPVRHAGVGDAPAS